MNKRSALVAPAWKHLVNGISSWYTSNFHCHHMFCLDLEGCLKQRTKPSSQDWPLLWVPLRFGGWRSLVNFGETPAESVTIASDRWINSGDWRSATMPDVLQFSAAVERYSIPALVELADCKCNQLAVRCDRQKKDCYLEMGSTASTLMMVKSN